VVIAEIAAGIIAGRSGFNIVQNDLWIEFLSLFGFAYLMFLSGVEIDFAYFTKSRSRAGGRANPLIFGPHFWRYGSLFEFLRQVAGSGGPWHKPLVSYLDLFHHFAGHCGPCFEGKTDY
jgi:Kef-type K+ transport system membrane component KefB